MAYPPQGKETPFKRTGTIISPRTAGDDIEIKNGNIFGQSFFMDKTLTILEEKPGDADVVVVNGSYDIPIKIGDTWFMMNADVELDTSTDLDTGSISNGTDYYVYALNNGGSLDFNISLNATYPSGYAANTSEKIGGFHTLCTNVGTIASHDLSDYLANNILPKSIWDLVHRPRSAPQGMLYNKAINKWVDIYLASGTGASTVSVNGGTISDTRNWMDFVDDGHAVLKQLLNDEEFQSIATGSNEETNIVGNADPVTTGGHSDTAGRRMISNIGCEDCCGALNQWLNEQSTRIESSHTHTQTITHKASATGSALFKDQAESTPNAVLGSAADETITGNATDIASWAWYNLPGSKGSLYRQGTYGDIKLPAGSNWADGTACGSRSRAAHNSRWTADAHISARFLAEPL
jgi:hypothetical protein